MDADTELDEGLAVGDLVKVEGWILPDSTWLAGEIRRLEDEERAFEFTGSVESIAPWIVSGVALETDEWTEIDAEIVVGDAVRVKGQILEDGTWMATEIKLLDEELSYVEFVGQVEGIDPWIVSGVTLAVDDETEIEGEIEVGDWVRVRAQILPDGTWLAVEIEPIDAIRRGGCMWFSCGRGACRSGTDRVGQRGSRSRSISGIPIEGEIQVNSVVLVQVCVGEDGTLTVVRIIVVYQLEIPPATPTPVASPHRRRQPEEVMVTICHKPGTPAQQTKLVPQSALKGHLGHGDTLGPLRRRRGQTRQATTSDKRR